MGITSKKFDEELNKRKLAYIAARDLSEADPTNRQLVLKEQETYKAFISLDSERFKKEQNVKTKKALNFFKGKKNPVPASSEVQKDLAQDLYKKFTGHDEQEEIIVSAPNIPDEMTFRGDITEIEYDTVRDNTKEYYRHKFRKNSRPVFLADRNIFVIAGGKYQFTELGIVDRGTDGKIGELDKPEYPKATLFVGMCYALKVLLNGRVHYYQFKSRPALVASYDGNQLFLLGGAYNFT